MITVSDAMNAFIKTKTDFQESIMELETAWSAPSDRAMSRMMIGQAKQIPELDQDAVAQLESEIGGSNADTTIQRPTDGYGQQEL